jgi:primosomal protein N' (replication factor Y)
MTSEPAIAKAYILSQARHLNRVFDYCIPDELQGKVMPGSRVKVSFQNTPNTAIVTEIVAQSDFTGLKPILELLDDQPLLGPIQLRLANWLADYYFCSRADALRLFLPPGAAIIRQTLFETALTQVEWRELLTARLPEERLELVLKQIQSAFKEKFSARRWQDLFNSFPGLWEELLREGWLHPKHGLASPRTKPKQERVFQWVEGREPDTSSAGKIFAQLTTVPQGMALARICALSGCSSSVLTRLVKQGSVTETTLRVLRQPIGLITEHMGTPVQLNNEQQTAFDAIIAAPFSSTFLLHGVTGSGKTEVYFEAANYYLQQGKQVLYLVPEIALTPQTLERAQRRFGGHIALLHSNMSDGERYDQWFRIQHGEARFVLGARSALFAPFTDLGLIIMDEEHESSYKQDETPRYHSRTVAGRLAAMTGAKLILGSATPSLESYFNAKSGDGLLLELTQRFNKNPLPQVSIVDMRSELKTGNRKVLSGQLQQWLTETMAAGEQAILLLNRRGHSTFVLCRDCGSALRCPDCEISLTYHMHETALRCHYCDYRQSIPDRCPNCSGSNIRYFGHGTQKLEEELGALFPQGRILRMDQDSTTRKGAHHRIYQQLSSGDIDILLGTQMVAKGWDLPRVTLVGVIAADSTLNLPDFRAAERTFQLLTQVAGRTGRGAHHGRVLFQTYHSEHYAVQHATTHNYSGFYSTEIENRCVLDYPPFAELVRVSFAGVRRDQVEEASHTYARLLQQAITALSRGNADTVSLEIMGPAPAVLSIIQRRHRWQLIIKSGEPKALETVMQSIGSSFPYNKFNDVKIFSDRNPYSVL